MRSSLESLGLLSLSVMLGSFAAGCSSNGSSFADGGGGGGGGMDGTIDVSNGLGVTHTDGQTLGSGPGSGGSQDAGFGADAFFAMDPPLMYCGVDGGQPPTPGGTPTCPSDKNREGCPCPTVGMTAACWPGLRVDRGLGQCKDGTTTCTTTDEGTQQVWGACVGYVLPTPGATGAAACQCFSSGQWNIVNLSPCTYEMGSMDYGAASVLSGSTITCPSTTWPPTPPATWSTDTVKVDCAGTFTLCYTIKAGSATSPQPTDCVVGQACVTDSYTTANTVQPFPPLPGWAGSTAAEAACAAQFNATGGYGQMTVQGKSEYCQGIGADDGGAPMVFNTLPYCGPDAGPSCQSGGSGTFGQ
jgi:hypothetical protein